MKTTKQTLAILFLFLCLIFADNSFSQYKNFGIKGGLNLSNVNFDNDGLDNISKNKTGFNIAVLYDFLNYRNVSVSAEAGYSQKGFDNDFLTTDVNGNIISSETIHSKLNYIDVDILVRFFLNTKYASPYLSIGPVLGFYPGYSASSTGPNDTLFQENILLENLKSPSFGIIVGAGTEFKNLMPVTLIIEMRYNFDITNSSDAGSIEFKNKLFEFNTGVKF